LNCFCWQFPTFFPHGWTKYSPFASSNAFRLSCVVLGVPVWRGSAWLIQKNLPFLGVCVGIKVGTAKRLWCCVCCVYCVCCVLCVVYCVCFVLCVCCVCRVTVLCVGRRCSVCCVLCVVVRSCACCACCSLWVLCVAMTGDGALCALPWRGACCVLLCVIVTHKSLKTYFLRENLSFFGRSSFGGSSEKILQVEDEKDVFGDWRIKRKPKTRSIRFLWKIHFIFSKGKNRAIKPTSPWFAVCVLCVVYCVVTVLCGCVWLCVVCCVLCVICVVYVCVCVCAECCVCVVLCMCGVVCCVSVRLWYTTTHGGNTKSTRNIQRRTHSMPHTRTQAIEILRFALGAPLLFIPLQKIGV
jgi:hypothetical protein